MEERHIPPTLASAETKIDDGYIVAARGPDGVRWRADDRQAMRSALRRLTHVLVLGAAVVPVTITVASATPAPQVQQRLGIQLPESALESMAASHSTYQSVTRDTPREGDIVIAVASPSPAPTNNANTALATTNINDLSTAAIPAPGGGRGVFPYGYCTWYVSTRRYIPWSGNAGVWYAAAQAMGFAVGATPRPGAIMVSQESWIGHVAYVESVSGNTFVVSEMNFRGFGIVDQRRITLGQIPLIGFIY